MSDEFIFICKTEDNEYFAGRKNDIEFAIKRFEDANTDLPFTTVAKIKEPPYGLPMGFPEQLIQWYKDIPDKHTVDLAVMAIVQFLQNGFINI